jgi:uncharacterized protein
MFVDTSAWYAAYVANDPHHAVVKNILASVSSRLITTDQILAESLTLLRARGEYARAVLLGRDLLAGGVAQIIRLTADDLEKAFVIFSTYADQAWSFVDCTSFVAMQRMNVRDALSLDGHFRQMPGIVVHP